MRPSMTFRRSAHSPLQPHDYDRRFLSCQLHHTPHPHPNWSLQPHCNKVHSSRHNLQCVLPSALRCNIGTKRHSRYLPTQRVHLQYSIVRRCIHNNFHRHFPRYHHANVVVIVIHQTMHTNIYNSFRGWRTHDASSHGVVSSHR